MNRPKAFTLIELLVVIAILAFVDGHVGIGHAENGYHLGMPRGFKPKQR